MDGNGRWATLRNRDRFWGHLRGARVAQNTIEECSRMGIQVLTLFAFSTENWFRPEEEVAFLMHLLRRQLKRKRGQLISNNIRFKIIGDMQRLPDFVQEEAQKTIEMTAKNTGMTLVFALSYGSRLEIVKSCRAIAERVQCGELAPADVDEQLFGSFLATKGLPDPDLILRTSGEYRLSNFLLWQAAYSEIFISESLWPDFSNEELHEIVKTFENRERRFGRVAPQTIAISEDLASNNLNH